jgi:hypothetical protein
MAIRDADTGKWYDVKGKGFDTSLPEVIPDENYVPYLDGVATTKTVETLIENIGAAALTDPTEIAGFVARYEALSPAEKAAFATTSAYADLMEAAGTPGETVDKTALQNAITQADALLEANYTPESWTPFQAALDAAKVVNANEDATQAEVDATAEALDTAKEALVLIDEPEGVTLTAIAKAGAGARDSILIQLTGISSVLQDLDAIRAGLEIVSSVEGEEDTTHMPGQLALSTDNWYSVPITPVLPEYSEVKESLDGGVVVGMTFDFSTSHLTYKITFDGVEFGKELTAEVTESTMVELTAYREDGEIATDLNGIVAQFESSAGGTFGRNNAANVAAFDSGKAEIRMNAPALSETVVDTIKAYLLEGETSVRTEVASNVITYTPRGGGVVDTEHISVANMFVQNAYSVLVTFNAEYDKDRLSNSLTSFNISRDSTNNVTVHPVNFTPHAVRQEDGTYVEDKFSARLQLLQADALTDNNFIQLTTIGNGYVNNGYTGTRALTDAIAPYVTGLNTDELGDGKLRVYFSEPVATRDAGVPAYAGLLDNWKINGKPLVAADLQLDSFGNPTTSLNVVAETAPPYVPAPDDRSNLQDNRCWIDIYLSVTGLQKLIPEAGVLNLLEIAHARDFAGLTDGNGNEAQTQSFSFASPTTPEPPKFTVTRQSVEQFLVEADRPLTRPLRAINVTFEHLSGISVLGVPNWLNIPVENSNDALNIATPARKVVTLTPLPNTNNRVYLLELNADWTVIKNTKHDTANPNGGPNSHSTIDQDKVKITFTSRTANRIENLWGKELEAPADIGNSTAPTHPANSAVSPANPSVMLLPEDNDGAVAVAVDGITYAPETVYNYVEDLVAVAVTMNEPIQVNTSLNDGLAERTTPLTPSVQQMHGRNITFNTSAASNATYINGGHLAYEAIQPISCTFTNDVTKKVITGKIDAGSVSADDKTFTVVPTDNITNNKMKAGESWTLTISEFSDDVANANNTISIKLKLRDPDAPAAPSDPYVVWITANDNLYDLVGGSYTIGDFVHVQYSQRMAPTTVGRSEAYSLNGVPFAVGLNVDLEDVIYDFDDDGNPIVGTLATIHLPYTQLGDTNQHFVATLADFIADGLAPSEANPYDGSDPYAPYNRGIFTVPRAAANYQGTVIQPLRQHNEDTYSVELTYLSPSLVDEDDIQPNINAYVNSVGAPSANYLELAYLEDALDSQFVKGILLTNPLYSEATGLAISLDSIATITINYTNEGQFYFAIPQGAVADEVIINANDVWSIDFGKVDTVTARAEDVTINSLDTTEIRVAGKITGTLTLDVPEAHVWLNGDPANASTTGAPDIATVVVTHIASDTLTINGNVFITTIEMQCGGTIVNGGVIGTIDIETNQIVTLAGTYLDGTVATTINLNKYAYVVNATDGDETLELTDVIGGTGAIISVTPGNAYPSGSNSAVETSIVADLNNTTDWATTTSLSSEAYAADLYITITNVDATVIDPVKARGGANGLAITNAIVAYRVANSSVSAGDVKSIIENAVAAFDTIIQEAASPGGVTNITLFNTAGIHLGSADLTRINNATWPETVTFESLQTFIDNL